MRQIDDETFKLLLKHRLYYKQGILIPSLQRRLRASITAMPRMTREEVKQTLPSRFGKALNNLKNNKETNNNKF